MAKKAKLKKTILIDRQSKNNYTLYNKYKYKTIKIFNNL